ncbi:MAG: amidase family protein [Solirubrobacterales bacterium]
MDSIHAESRKVLSFWDDYDVLITPTFTRTGPRIGEMGADPATAGDEHLDWLSFTYPANCTGQPAISLPLAIHSDGLPIGIQLVGPPQGEAVILALSAQLEAARPWASRARRMGLNAPPWPLTHLSRHESGFVLSSRGARFFPPGRSTAMRGSR